MLLVGTRVAESTQRSPLARPMTQISTSFSTVLVHVGPIGHADGLVNFDWLVALITKAWKLGDEHWSSSVDENRVITLGLWLA